MDRDSARDLLARLDASATSARTAMRSDRNRHANLAAFVGLAMAVYLLVTMVFIDRAPWLWAAVLVLYVAGIVVMCWRFNRLRRSAPHTWQRRYRNGFLAGMVFFVAGIVLNTVLVVPHHWSVPATLALALPLSVATALPLLVVARRTVRDDA